MSFVGWVSQHIVLLYISVVGLANTTGFCSYFGCKPERFSSVIRKASIAKLLTSFNLEFSFFIDHSSSIGIHSKGFLLAL